MAEPWNNRIETVSNFAGSQLSVYVNPGDGESERRIMIQRTIYEPVPDSDPDGGARFAREVTIALNEETARWLRKRLKWAINYQPGDPLPEF